jgi:FemAB-related protein (PEP-CTERM system-associated)
MLPRTHIFDLVMRVAEFTGRTEEWNNFVRGQRGWSHFHLFGWKNVVTRVFGHECIYLSARDEDGRLAGVLPLVRVKSLVFGHYLVSMPFVNYGGPLGSDEAVTALVSYAADLLGRENVKLLELRSRFALPVSHPVSHRKITVVLDLPPDDAEPLWRGFDAKVRNQVRRPQKEGVIVQFGVGEVIPFFEVFSRHMRDLGTPTQPRRLFETLSEAFPEDVWFGCAYYRGRAIAGGCGLRWGHEFEMTWASALAEYKPISANMLLYWAFMERGVREGVRTFNFGRCTPGSGTHRFKRQWGSRDEPLWWYDLSRLPNVATPSPNDSAFAWGPRIWKRLPVRVTRALGPNIVRYIP